MDVEVEQVMPESTRPTIPKIRGTQIGLSNPGQIDQIKADMLAKRFDYSASRLAGVKAKGIYYVKVGHHRMAAAMEIYKEKGDSEPVFQLLKWGAWDQIDKAPHEGCPLPSRHWWGAFRNWLRF